MAIEDLPDKEKIVDTLAEVEYLKVETEIGDISLDSYNQINIQPKGTIFGTKIEVDDNGNIIPTLTFDTKKLKEPKKDIDPKDIVDQALEDFWNGEV
jgi:hypothetical protein